MRKSILIIEDDRDLCELLEYNLSRGGYDVRAITRLREAETALAQALPDLIILDVMLPEINGFQICEQIRLTNMEVPVIFLTAKDGSADRIAGLKKGADDYLTKPFHLEELLLRVNNLIRRTSKAPENTPEVYTFGNNKVNFLTYEAEGINGKFTLTKKEAMLIKLLIDRKNEVVSRHQILQSVWGYDVFPSTRTIDNFILSFRKYFEEDQREPRFFHSIRGVGYKFTG